MRAYEYDRLADRLRLHRQVDPRPIIVCEGPADERFFGRVLPPGAVAVFPAGGRDRVLEFAADPTTAEFGKVACVVDRDFDDEIATAESDGLPLAPYDGADLEQMLWDSPALADALGELASATKLIRFGGVTKLRAVAIAELLPVHRLRRASAVEGWGLPFDGIDLAARIDVHTLEVGRQSLCDALWDNTLPVGKSDVYEAAASYPETRCPASGDVLIRGKDALALAASALRRRIGSLGHQATRVDRLAEILRLAATPHSVAATAWRVRIRELLSV